MLYYRRLERSEIDDFITLRIRQLQEEGEQADCDLAPCLKAYYNRHWDDGSFVSWIAEEDGEIVATSGMSFVEKPPYYGNPSGKVGLLSSMYTRKEYRRRGIAKELLRLVVEEARGSGCGMVQIAASDMGMLLYRDFGFEENRNFMQLKLL